MSIGQRFTHVLTGLLMIALGVLMIMKPEDCVVIAAGLLSVSLTLKGIRYLVYYFTMARHMVGGKRILYVSIITLDLGLFTATMLDTPRFYIFFYLIAAYAFSGIINLLRGLEARSYGGTTWKLSLVHGGVSILIAFACVIFIRSADILVVFYSAGLIYSALIRITTAFRRTAIVYIQ